MADKAISELVAASQVTATDLFVLEQSGTAKKLTGQVLENWLLSFAGGHGGIHSIDKLSTNGLVDTYRITLADTTTFDFAVTNGKSIDTIEKTKTSGLVDTYTIRFNDRSSSTFTVTNGEKGDKGDNQYIWIKYASQEPTESSHSFGDVPDNWIGIYSGESETAPTEWTQYQWFEIKGDKGDPGDPAILTERSVTYQTGDSGTLIPSGTWLTSIPVVPQGKYLWTRTELVFNSGDPITSYNVSRMGLDGLGSVVSVCDISPDPNGNIPLTAEDVGALSKSGGSVTGSINMNGQKLYGLNDPTANDEAATKRFVESVAAAKLSLELLWQNPSPNSDFAATPEGQPLPVTDAITKGTHCLIDFVGNEPSIIVQKGVSGTQYKIATSEGTSATYINWYHRTIAVNDYGISVGNAYFVQYKTSTQTATNREVVANQLKPSRVWIIKGVP